MAYTHLYGNLTVAANIVNEYENTFNEALKEVLANDLRDLIIKNLYYPAFGLSLNKFNNLSNDDVIKGTITFLKDIQNTLHPLGLHAIGEPWNDEDVANTVSAMISHDFDMDNNAGRTNLLKLFQIIITQKIILTYLH